MNNDSKTIDQVQPQIPVVPAQPVQGLAGSLNKETEPVGASASLSELSPAGSEVNHKITEELEALGVKEANNRPDLTQVPNVRHAGPSVPVKTEPSGLVQSPLTKEEAMQSMKTKGNNDSGKWWAGLFLKVLKAAGLAGS